MFLGTPSRRSLACSEQLHMLLEIQLHTTSSVSTDKTLQETPNLSNDPDLSMKTFPTRCSRSQISSLCPVRSRKFVSASSDTTAQHDFSLLHQIIPCFSTFDDLAPISQF